MDIIGRKEEIRQLQKALDSNKSEFVVVYGRRRVGKTFLVNRFFGGKFSFSHTGFSPNDGEDNNTDSSMSEGLLKDQLEHFASSLCSYGYPLDKDLTSWLEAFGCLRDLLNKDKSERKVVFIDELPWLDTPKSNFMRELEFFWNSYASMAGNIVLVVAGSSVSYIASKLINNYGGLYGRVSRQIKLAPFTLAETSAFLTSIDVNYSQVDVAMAQMIFGGVPYYLGMLDGRKSLSQNIDALFFGKNAALRSEFDRLFRSCFKNPERMRDIVLTLGKRSSGFSRDEIASEIGLSSGKNLTEYLEALLSSDFILDYIPFGESKRSKRFKLIDPFCLFYMRFVADSTFMSKDFFTQNVTSPTILAWRGYAFENLCFEHVDQIKFALGISGVATSVSPYSKKGKDGERGTQIDMILSRADNVVDICEMKFVKGEYEQDLPSHLALVEREEAVSALLKRRESVAHVLVTSFGLKRGAYSFDYSSVIALDDLMRF